MPSKGKGGRLSSRTLLKSHTDSSVGRPPMRSKGAEASSSPQEKARPLLLPEEALAQGLRPCHDCTRPTANYRCPFCLVRWRKRHGICELDVIAESYTLSC